MLYIRMETVKINIPFPVNSLFVQKNNLCSMCMYYAKVLYCSNSEFDHKNSHPNNMDYFILVFD